MRKLEGIKAISFDADNTLWDFNLVMRHALGCALAELVAKHPKMKGNVDVDLLARIRGEVAATLKGRITNLEEIRLEAFKETLRRLGVADDTLAAHLNAVYLKHRYEDIKLYDDVSPALSQLRDKYALGVLSNGNSLPGKCGLDGVFKYVVFSQDYGVEKPDPRLFAIAVQKAGCMKAQFLHVGDSLDDDIAGAENAGVRSVWLNRNRLSRRSGLVPEFEIASLAELPGLLGASQ